MIVGLVGHPVTHSRSPAMHHAAFATVGLVEWEYRLWDVLLEALPMRISALHEDAQVAGFNVTVPHKEAVIALLDGLSDAARRIGAVNTVVKTDGRLFGHNTDWLGFLADLRRHGVDPAAIDEALVLGAGGSARAVTYALLASGVRVAVLSRNQERAGRLAADMQWSGSAVRVVPSPAECPGARLIVNCTPAGMTPNDAETPWPEGATMPAEAVVYDLVYQPGVTRLMLDAQRQGIRAIGGAGMLAEQGAAAFELWTGIAAGRVADAMRAALDLA